MAKRCTPFQSRRRVRSGRPPATMVEVVRRVFPFSHSFDRLDGTERRCVWRLEIPCSGAVLEPRVSAGRCEGEISLDAAYNGVVVATVPLSGGVADFAGRSWPVKAGDIIELFVHGGGTANEVAISLVVKEG